MSCKTGRVIAHKEALTLADAKFVIRKSGQDRVRREGKKNVHAFVVGYFSLRNGLATYPKAQKVIYNPYKNDTFVFADTQEPIEQARVTTMGIHKDKPSMWAEEVTNDQKN
jgi:hypothetical protein